MRKNNTGLFDPVDNLSRYFSDQGAWFCLSQPENVLSIIGSPLILSDSNGYCFMEELLTLSAVTINNHEIKFEFTDEYMMLKNKLLTRAEGLMGKGVPLRENYDPRNGSGLNAEHFSWTAAHLLMIVGAGK